MEIPQDDLMYVMEMTQKLENYIGRMFRDNECNIAMSALMSATINTVLSQSKTLQEVMFYRKLFVDIFDGSIRSIRLND